MNQIDLNGGLRVSACLRQLPYVMGALALAMGVSGALHPAAAQKKIVTVVLSEEPEGLDGCNANRSTVGRVVKQNIVETLTEIDPKDGSIAPRLALSWEKVDEKTWRFKLRQGVKFHDGAPFNAETAAKAILRTMDTSIKTGNARGTGGLDCETRTKSFGDLKIVGKAIDEYTLEITANKTVPILPTQMGVVSLSSPNTPNDKLVLNPIGTGPYKFEKWTPGQEITLGRNDGFWGKKPEADGVRYIWRKESTVRAAMVKVGEADIAPDIAVQDANDPSMDFSYPNSETSRLRIDLTRAPLNDKRVRLAINYAIDREALKSVLSKDVIPASQIVVAGINGHNPKLKPYAYDLAKAKKLIAEAKAAGVPVDKELEIVGRTNIYPNGTEHMEATMAMLQAAGFKVKLRMLEVAEWLDILTKPYAEDRGPVLLQEQHDNNNGDAVFSVFNKFACKGAQSVTCDEKLDAMIAKASALSGEERTKTWQEVLRVIHEDNVSDVWMYHMVGYSRVGKRVNFKPSISTNSEIHIEKVTFKK
jgi:peptide/nickel transport system substrate-binding protein